MPVNRIILVYNGDSGLGAMLLDVVKKAVGREDCALCEITYSPIGKRQAWAACEARLGIPVETKHRDDLPASWGISRTELPCILGRTGDDTPFVLLNRTEIAACQGSVEALERRLRSALDQPSAAAAH
jgi:hypothetical protein